MLRRILLVAGAALVSLHASRLSTSWVDTSIDKTIEQEADTFLPPIPIIKAAIKDVEASKNRASSGEGGTNPEKEKFSSLRKTPAPRQSRRRTKKTTSTAAATTADTTTTTIKKEQTPSILPNKNNNNAATEMGNNNNNNGINNKGIRQGKRKQQQQQDMKETPPSTPATEESVVEPLQQKEEKEEPVNKNILGGEKQKGRKRRKKNQEDNNKPVVETDAVLVEQTDNTNNNKQENTMVVQEQQKGIINPDRTWRPSEEWLQTCVKELDQNQTGLLKPFVSWRNMYGLGDCIKMCARCRKGQRDFKDRNLAIRYEKMACDLKNPNYVSGGNLTIVEQLLKQYAERENNPTPPSPDAIVIHLRVGDVIEKSKQSTAELLLKGGDPKHTGEFKSSIKSVYEFLDNLQEANATKVVIIGGAFRQHHYEKSRVYAACLERAIQQSGYSISMDLDAPDADYDFYYMTNAKRMIVSAGGYSALIGKLIQRNGGKVIGRMFDDPSAVKKYEIQTWGSEATVNYWKLKHIKANAQQAQAPQVLPTTTTAFSNNKQQDETTTAGTTSTTSIRKMEEEEEVKIPTSTSSSPVGTEIGENQEEPAKNQVKKQQRRRRNKRKGKEEEVTSANDQQDLQEQPASTGGVVVDGGGTSLATTATKVINPDRTWRPSEEWLQTCVKELDQNQTGLLKPFVSWRNMYGLGDCIKMCARCRKGQRDFKDKNLAIRYEKLGCDLKNPNYVSGGNLTIVEQLLKEYAERENNPTPPSPDAIIIHLRVGDVIEKSKQSTTELLLKGGDPKHTGEFKSSIKSVYEFLDNLEQANATQVVIIGGAFRQHHYEKSRVYAACLERAIQQSGYSISMDLDAPDADYDFYYMTNARRMIVSAGGYSALIGKLIQRNGGQVIGRMFDDPSAVKKYEIQTWGEETVTYWKQKYARDNEHSEMVEDKQVAQAAEAANHGGGSDSSALAAVTPHASTSSSSTTAPVPEKQQRRRRNKRKDKVEEVTTADQDKDQHDMKETPSIPTEESAELQTQDKVAEKQGETQPRRRRRNKRKDKEQEETTVEKNNNKQGIDEAASTGGVDGSTSKASTKVINPDRKWRPSEEWLQTCVKELDQNQTGLLKPFVSWRNMYGLGDCIKMCARCRKGQRDPKDKNLAIRYSKLGCDLKNPNYVSGGNLTIVEQLLKEYAERENNPTPPSPDAIVIHLRVGDVIEKSKQSTTELLLKGGDPKHTGEFKSSIKSVYEFLDNLEQANATQVVIIGGAFRQHHYEKSRVYAACLERAIQQSGYSISMDLDAPDADYDFYYMTNAKRMIVSAGGYSALIGKLIQRNGGQVIGRMFDDPSAVKKYEIQTWGEATVNFWKQKHARDNGQPLTANK